jgi:hypothetical protein
MDLPLKALFSHVRMTELSKELSSRILQVNETLGSHVDKYKTQFSYYDDYFPAIQYAGRHLSPTVAFPVTPEFMLLASIENLTLGTRIEKDFEVTSYTTMAIWFRFIRFEDFLKISSQDDISEYDIPTVEDEKFNLVLLMKYDINTSQTFTITVGTLEDLSSK